MIGFVHVFIAFWIGSYSFVELGGFIVKQDFRRQGIGRRLFTIAEERIIQNDITKLRIRSHSNRVDAHAFYEQLGFSKLKEQHVFDKSLKTKAE